MPHATDRSARLFYDDSCGPCRLLARAAERASRHRLEAIPLDSPAADATLRGLPPETRYAYAHLETGRDLRTGADLATPLFGLSFGPTWERVVRRVPYLERSLTRAYARLWNYRRTRGCAAGASTGTRPGG
jgi:hypothetical protein